MFYDKFKAIFTVKSGRKFIAREAVIKQGVMAAIMQVFYIFLVTLFLLIGEAIFINSMASIILGLASFFILLILSIVISMVLVLAWPFYYALEKQYPLSLFYLLGFGLTMLMVFMILWLGAVIM